MSVTQEDLRIFISGMANTFSLLRDVFEEDEAMARSFTEAFVTGDKPGVENVLRQATIEMDYGRRVGDDGAHRLSFHIAGLSVVLEVRATDLPAEPG
jgi:hypothetical protein